MLRESQEISAEERMGMDLFLIQGDAFHKKITIPDVTPRPNGFWWADEAGYGPNGERLVKLVAPDNVKVPPEIKVIAVTEFEEGAAFGEPYKASKPPHELYQDVHTHGPANVSVGGIPVKPVNVE